MDGEAIRKQEYRDLGVNAWDLLRHWCLEDAEWRESFVKEDVVVSRYVSMKQNLDFCVPRHLL